MTDFQNPYSANPYSPPSADITTQIADQTPRFYVVAPKKFLILFIATVGLYEIYWFFKNWSNFKIKTNESIWPVPRAIFSVFFAHSLFDKVDKSLKYRNNERAWNPAGLATIFVVFQILSNVAERLAGKDIGMPITAYISLISLPIITWALYQAQLAINQACGEPNGESNQNLSGANYIWIVLGVFYWCLIILGLYTLTTELPL
ncbi:MAG: hypothetical protein WBO07_05510 [Formosimonas sp.]|jgi:hypothetical protein